MNMNDTQWIMQLTQALYSTQQTTAARPVKDNGQDKGKSDFQSLLENKTAQGNPETPVESSPAEGGAEQLEENSAVQGAAAQVLMPLLNQMPVMQPQVQTETGEVQMVETLPAEIQTAELPQAAQNMQQVSPEQVPAAEEMPLVQAEAGEVGEKQPVFTQQTNETAITGNEKPAESGAVQETVPAVKPAEDNQVSSQSGTLENQTEEEPELQAQAAVEQPLFQETAQMPQKVGQPQVLDTESPDFETKLDATITQALKQDTQKVELRLEPENLGKLVIQMEKSPEGVLRVVLQVSNDKALQMLKDHSGTLGLMLQNSQPGQVRLEVQRQESSQQPWNQQEQNQNQNQNQSQQQQHQRRQESQQSEDFLQKLRLGLMPA